ncbi:hypothetical protein [Amycolatopsis sp. lyj-346]|uniref:hypothetical protein n=1 Tax=Amycolatopsis sp. lyj-346 TaxID=2789289 RepID=UPI00397B434A
MTGGELVPSTGSLGGGSAHRMSGLGRSSVTALAELARERGCYGMWVVNEGTTPR